MSSLALGSPIRFDQSANVNQYAFFVQDNIKFGDFQVQAGLRVGHYHGIVSDTSAQPRIGFSYLIKPTGTVLRASYSRTFETPYNENLILSSATGVGGLASNVFGAVGEPLPGTRNQYNAGIEQAFGRWLVASADYFWKYTNNAYDFGVLFNTPIAFPIAWNKSKLDGVAVRIGTPNLHGFQWYHDHRAIPGHDTFHRKREVWSSTATWKAARRVPHRSRPGFPADHRAAVSDRKNWPVVSWTWRYDSGLVAGSVGSLEDALALTGAEQAIIGFFCGSSFRRSVLPSRQAQCTPANYGATDL